MVVPINSAIVKIDKKPLKPFMRFREQAFSILVNTHPGIKEEHFERIVSKLWRDMSKADRDFFVRDYEQDIGRYQEEVPHFNVQPKFLSNVFMEEQVSSQIEDDQNIHSRKKIAAYRCKLNDLLMDSIFDSNRALDCDFSFAATNISTKKRFVSYLSSVRETTSSQIKMMVLEHEAKLRSIEHFRKSFDEKMTNEICKTVII